MMNLKILFLIFIAQQIINKEIHNNNLNINPSKLLKSENSEINYSIPKIENNIISILLFNDEFSTNSNTKYTILLVEDKNGDDNLMNQLNDEKYLFSLINNEIKDINYLINNQTVTKNMFLYSEINYNKFNTSRFLLIKIFTCENAKNKNIFSKTQRIYLENLQKDNDEDEFGVKKIEEFIEYNITRKEYIFSFNYKNYLNTTENVLLYITIPTILQDNYEREFELINPLMKSFTFRFTYTEEILFKKGEHIVSNGKYYLIFKNCKEASFYIHDTLHFLPLNKINNYVAQVSQTIRDNQYILYFYLELEQSKIIYLDVKGTFYSYSIGEKKTVKYNTVVQHGFNINKGSYIFILDYSQKADVYYCSIGLNHYLIDLDKNKEIEVEKISYFESTVSAIVNISKYDNELYLVSDSKNSIGIKCEKGFDINNIIDNKNPIQNILLKSYINNIYELGSHPCDPPFYNLMLNTARFELTTEVYNIINTTNLLYQKEDTAAFTVNGYGYNLIISNQENLKRIDKMENEFVNIIFANETTQFKLRPNKGKETNLKIIILENENNIEIEALTNTEIASRIFYNNNNKEIKYYINLSKNKFLINHFDYEGNLDFYISKEEINENNLPEILKSNEINMDLFDYITNKNFDLDINKILAIKKENIINSDLIMSPEIHNFVIDNINSKILIANKRYYMGVNMKILMEENSDATIKVIDLNNKIISIINKVNSTFENTNYEEPLFLISDKETLIYIYHQIKSNSRNIIYPIENNKGQFLLFKSDCEQNQLNYKIDFGYDNYISSNLNLKELTNDYITLSFPSNLKIQSKANYVAHIECRYYLVHNYSGFYENSYYDIGSTYIENKPVYFALTQENDKKNIFYQNFICDSDIKNEFMTLIDGQEQKELKDDNFINFYNNISFYFKGKSIFNFYKSTSSLEDYKRLEKNSNPYYNISLNAKNESKIDILPLYKNIDFEFYLLMYIDKDNKLTDNPFKDRCYIKKLIEEKEQLLNDENLIIKEFIFKNNKLVNNTIDIQNLTIYSNVYSNVYGKGKILDDIEVFIFYNEQNQIYRDSESEQKTEPESKSPTSKGGLSTGAIIGIIIGLIILLIIVAFTILRIRKTNSIIDINDTGMIPLT